MTASAIARRHDRAADRRALLAGLDRHLGDDALDEQVELGVVDGRRRGRGSSSSASRPRRRAATPPCSTLGWLRSSPAVCAEPVNATESCTVELVEQPAGLPHSSWSEPSGRMPDSMIRRTTSSVRYAVWLAGLTMLGRPGEERGRELLEHPPDREVEGVDLDRDAGPRGVDVLADERARRGRAARAAVEEDGVVGQLADALAGEAEQRAEAAVDVDHRVALGRAGAERELVELVLVLPSGAWPSALSSPARSWKVSARIAGPPTVAGVRRHRAEVEARAEDPGDLLAGGGVEQRACPRRSAVNQRPAA